MHTDFATPLRIGVCVETFTRRTGRVVALLPGERVAVELVLHPKGGEASPVRCARSRVAAGADAGDGATRDNYDNL